MITLSNGYGFEYVAASGALAFDGKGWPWEWPLRWLGFIDPSLFTVVIKTLTLEPRKGNLQWWKPWGCVRFLWDGKGRIVGTVNSVGLTNPGIGWWCRIGFKIDLKKIALVGSILGEPSDLKKMAGMLNSFPLKAIEINASCPNTDEGVLKNTERVIESCVKVRSASRFPIILKLSVVHDIEKILPRIKGVVEAISINSVPWKVVFPEKESPLAHLGGGGVSGKVAQPYTWPFVARIAELTDIPIIGPSIWEFKDINRLRNYGASAISFGAVFLPYPLRPTRFVLKDIAGKSR